MDQHPYCPICDRYIMRPVWLPKKFTAYCEHCQRAYTENEIKWKKKAPSNKELKRDLLSAP